MKTIDDLPPAQDGTFNRIAHKKAQAVIALVKRGGASNRNRKVRKWDHSLARWERREDRFWKTL